MKEFLKKNYFIIFRIFFLLYFIYVFLCKNKILYSNSFFLSVSLDLIFLAFFNNKRILKILLLLNFIVCLLLGKYLIEDPLISFLISLLVPFYTFCIFYNILLLFLFNSYYYIKVLAILILAIVLATKYDIRLILVNGKLESKANIWIDLLILSTYIIITFNLNKINFNKCNKIIKKNDENLLNNDIKFGHFFIIRSFLVVILFFTPFKDQGKLIENKDCSYLLLAIFMYLELIVQTIVMNNIERNITNLEKKLSYFLLLIFFLLIFVNYFIENYKDIIIESFFPNFFIIITYIFILLIVKRKIFFLFHILIVFFYFIFFILFNITEPGPDIGTYEINISFFILIFLLILYIYIYLFEKNEKNEKKYNLIHHQE